MSRARTLAVAVLAVFALAAAIAAPAQAEFGLKNLSVGFEEEDGSPAIGAGTHPFQLVQTLEANTTADPELGEVPDGAVKDLRIGFPAGMVGNPTAVPPCSGPDFALIVNGGPSCSAASAIGTATVRIGVGFSTPSIVTVAVYNLTPPPGAAAKIGFVTLGVPITAELGVNPAPPYNVVATLDNIPQPVRFYGATVHIWGNPASERHDTQRGRCATEPNSTCPVSLPEKPFLTLPRSCSGPLLASFETDSWQNPLARLAYTAENPPGLSGCASLGLAPTVTSVPSTTSAASPSGLSFELSIEDEGLTSPEGTAESDIEKAVVTLPEGMTVNPGVAEGLATCSEGDLSRETAFSAPGEGCPQASKVGEVEVETPLLEGKLLHGQIFVATPEANPFGSLIALYMVIQSPELGILVKLPGKVTPDPHTGQLLTTFGEAGYEIPQFPFSHFRFHFREGARAPLITPPGCGTYTTRALFYPWASPASPVASSASFQIEHGPGGGPCPAGAPPFKPGFEAGSTGNAAGSYSPFYMRLTSADGEQDMTRFDAVLPPGVTGKIAGIPQCPDAAIAAARSRSGREELAQPSCPQASQLGRTLAGAGAGSALTWVPGSLYLSGPFGGDPLSIVAITPAVAGPFDAGTVVVREALTLNPATGEVEVDGAASEPIPHILRGIPLHLRDLRVFTDRPEFTLNPTSCEEEQARATLFGSGLDVFDPADDVPAALSARYQAADCAALAFKPRLALRMRGQLKRGGNPQLTATLTPRAGDANLEGTTVLLPHSEFIDQFHINSPCTRVQYSQGGGGGAGCPPSSVIGTVKAYTPLLSEPLTGNVYFRSNGGERELPDVVMSLNGQFRIEQVGFVDSRRGRLRTRFLSVPDAPISKVVLKLFGGKRGLLENSQDLCARRQRAEVTLAAHNGRRRREQATIATACRKHGKGKGKGHKAKGKSHGSKGKGR